MAEILLESLKQAKIIAIIRGIQKGTAVQVAEALYNGGISFLEFTLNTDGAIGMISEVKERYEGKLRIGAGTVLDVKMAEQAIAAGAEYLISPNLDEEVLQFGLESGVDVWPGTMTPTEISRAYKLGANAVKVFPIGALGVNYIKDVRAPLDHIPMIATGGINTDNIQQVLKNGAIAVGLGGNLVNNNLVLQGEFAEITKQAKTFVDLVKEV